MPRIALAGCGRWGRNILRDLLSLNCEVAVADPAAEPRQHATAAGAGEVAAELADLPLSDGVIIATPTSSHAAVIESALARNVPIFVEKPLTNDAAAARSLANRAEGRLFVMDKWRYHGGIEALAVIASSGELGAPLGMHLSHIGWGHPHRDVDVAWILLPHCLSIALEVLGCVPPVRYAFSEGLNGEIVALSGVLGDDPWVTLEASGRSPVKRREFRLHCERGVATVDEGCADHIKIARGSGGKGGDADNIEKRAAPTEMPLLREIRTFVEHLGGGPPPRSAAREGAMIVERIQELRDRASLA
jgi:predicted dehydrogenase